jgi:type I restriction enzyme, S subunit
MIGDLYVELSMKVESSRRLIGLLAALVECEYWSATEGRATATYTHSLRVEMGAPFAGKHFNDIQVGRPLIRIRDLSTFEPQIWTTESRADERVVGPGDVVVGMDAEFRSTLWLGPDGLLNQRVCRFVPLPGVSRGFALHALRHDLDYFERAKSGTTVVHLNRSDIDQFTAPVLSSTQHADLARATESLVDRLLNAASENRALARLRNAILPELLAGRLCDSGVELAELVS